MYFIVEECDFKPNGIVRYTICSTRQQYRKALNNSTMSSADGYIFRSKEEALDWLHEFTAVPKKEK